jgi:hypothetical protein
MKAELKEFKDQNGNVVMAVIWIIVPPFDYTAMNAARIKLNDFISQYVGHNGHNVYQHTEKDTVSAIISFDLDKYPGQTINL